jgi:hypothetical protein
MDKRYLNSMLICKGPDCKEVMPPTAAPGDLFSSRSQPLKWRCPKCGEENSYSKAEIDKGEANSDTGSQDPRH